MNNQETSTAHKKLEALEKAFIQDLRKIDTQFASMSITVKFKNDKMVFGADYSNTPYLMGFVFSQIRPFEPFLEFDRNGKLSEIDPNKTSLGDSNIKVLSFQVVSFLGMNIRFVTPILEKYWKLYDELLDENREM